MEHSPIVKPGTLLIIEPFYGGSHKQLVDVLIRNIDKDARLVSLSAKKWPWRARCGALILSTLIPPITTEEILFTTSVLNLPELLGLRPELCKFKKIVYFHENQLVYPVRQIKERDIQYAYNQIITCLAADVVIFNSQYNKNSFLNNIKTVIKIMPDYRPIDLSSRIEPKCNVLYYPMDYNTIPHAATRSYDRCLHIVWPHRWEFDKGPETFVNTLLKLKSHSCQFRASIIGETFQDVPDIMHQVKEQLTDKIIHYGFINSKEEYFRILQTSHVVISTAVHEFFGVSMLEATFCGCFPLVPNRLVYPEIYPEQCLYNNDEILFERLKEYCSNPEMALEHRRTLTIDFDKYSIKRLLPKYMEQFKSDVP